MSHRASTFAPPRAAVTALAGTIGAVRGLGAVAAELASPARSGAPPRSQARPNRARASALGGGSALATATGRPGACSLTPGS